MGGMEFLTEILGHDLEGGLAQRDDVCVQIEVNTVLVEAQMTVHADAKHGYVERSGTGEM